MKKRLVFAAVLAVALVLSGCGEAHSISIDSDFGILCSNFPAYDFARAAAGEYAALFR